MCVYNMQLSNARNILISVVDKRDTLTISCVRGARAPVSIRRKDISTGWVISVYSSRKPTLNCFLSVCHARLESSHKRALVSGLIALQFNCALISFIAASTVCRLPKRLQS